jgi:c-di-GMP-binding flagellar brake protein YcgR
MNQTPPLLPGTPVQLVFDNRAGERLPAQIIGHCGTQSILISAPSADEKVILIRKDQRVTVRFFHETTACAFETKVMHVNNTPYPYLHLSYPDSFSCDEVRKERRIKTCLDTSCSTRAGGNIKRGRGFIIDLSIHGLRLESDKELGDINEQIDVLTTIPVGHIERFFSSSGVIRSKRPIVAKAPPENSSADKLNADRYIYGIEFNELLEDNYILISSYIFSQIVEQGL